MKHLAFVCLGLAFLASCAGHQTTSAEAREALEAKYSDRVGSARKEDLMETFGNAEWCRPKEDGGETCRFYRKKGMQWVGDQKKDKRSYEMFDEVVAEFDSSGILRSFKPNAQR